MPPKASFITVRRLQLRIAIVASLFIILAPNTARLGADPQKVYADAVAYSRAGDCKKAIPAAGQAAKLLDNQTLRGRALFISGHCQYRLNNHAAARKDLIEASKLDPLLSFHGLYYGAMSYMNQDDFKNAVTLWDKLIAAHPPGDLLARAHMELVRAHRRAGDHDAAQKAVAAVRKLKWRDKGWDREIEYTQAWVRLQQGAYVEARSLLVALWREHPESFWAGQAEKLLQEQSGKLLLPGEMSPFTDGDRLRRIQTLLDRSDPGRALKELQPILDRAIKGSPPQRVASLYKLRGTAFMDSRDFTRAIDDFNQAQSMSPDTDIEINYYIGRCHQRAGRHQDAIDIYREIWTTHPDSSFATRALYYAARLLKLNNQWDGAEQAYLKLATNYPSSSFRAEALFQVAWLRFLQKDYAQARVYLEKVPRQSKDREFNARTLYWKSVVLHQLGEKALAEQAESAIIASYWDTAYSLYVLLQGKEWPYRAGSKVIPQVAENPPLEYKVAVELMTLGLLDDAEDQLKFLDDQGKMQEWLAWALAKMYLQLEEYHRAQRISYRKLGHRLKNPPPGEIEAWQVAYPRAFQPLVDKYAKRFEVDPLLVYSLMRAESTYRPTISSHAGAIGLMQVMPATGRQIAKELGEKGYQPNNLKNPDTNVRYGCYYLAQVMKTYADPGGDARAWLHTVTRALGSYNAGPGRIKVWSDRADELGLEPAAFVEEIPITETRDYVKRILRFYLIYHYTWTYVDAVNAKAAKDDLTHRTQPQAPAETTPTEPEPQAEPPADAETQPGATAEIKAPEAKAPAKPKKSWFRPPNSDSPAP